MSKKLTQILCVLDRSGSMLHIIDEAIGAFNSFIDAQKKLDGKAKVTLAIFDDKYEEVITNLNIKKVVPITKDVVFARGMTALNDAIGKTITNADNNKNTICLIQTDGMENASSEYTDTAIKEIIKKKEKEGWEFVFIGVGIDAFSAGTSYGLTKDQCVNVGASAAGMDKFSATLNSRTAIYRKN